MPTLARPAPWKIAGLRIRAKDSNVRLDQGREIDPGHDWITKIRKTTFFTTGACALCLLTGSPAVASEDSLVTSVFSSVHNGYVRARMPDGSYKRETYALANGQYLPGIARDHSIDSVTFPAIAGLVARRLAGQNYFLAQDAKSADLVLIITWGTTVPFNDAVGQANTNGLYTAMNNLNAANAGVKQSEALGQQQSTPDGIQSAQRSARDAVSDELEGQLYEMQMFNDMRTKANEQNARLLGYVKEINSRNDNSRFAGGGSYFDDLISDIESERYFVVVAAYDFRAATQERQRKLLWVTRVSIQAQGNRFNERLLAMLADASRQFGRDSGRLIRQYEPATRVDLGELKILGLVPESEIRSERAKQN